MATKTITITNNAYEKLFSLKEHKESFSDVINRLTGKHSILDLVGILSKGEANELRESITELRKRLRKQVDKTADRLK
ncbi:antitoxin VapB family protein [archaeon]|nr:antitoxin VapB family protein [archaeon]